MEVDGLLFAQVLSALADTLIGFDNPPPLRSLQREKFIWDFLPAFLRRGTHAACVMWVSSMAYGSANTTNNVAEYWGLVHGLRQAKASGYSPLHVVALVLSQLRTHHPPRKPHLALLFREARSIADNIGVSSWGHHYRSNNKMADRMANIAMDTGASIQVHASAGEGIVMEASAFLDHDVNHWMEVSQAEHHESQGHAMTPRNLIISRQDFARRRSAVRGLVVPST
ncbi:unnamed protein product [Peronospora farinosa]|uniref:RNase H type-1 domain-containing protein n=1 Tax=Peronospora farinosa TaxID=134698 RepID=A0AAV0SN48_9STRA|nr:unnamed protein product [Peronospora farinosa]